MSYVDSVAIRAVPLAEIQPFRDKFRAEANVQIIAYSMLPRELARAYGLFLEDRCIGYGAVREQYYPDHVHEFWLEPEFRVNRHEIFSRFLAVCGATQIQVQTNVPVVSEVLTAAASHLVPEYFVFEISEPVELPAPDSACTFETLSPGVYELRIGEEAVATGGYLTHYNPPFVDIHMAVKEGFRGRGFGSYFVARSIRQAFADGLIPAARCPLENVGSRRTLERAGFRVTGYLMHGPVRAASGPSPN